MQQIIVYRNPLEAQMWETLYSNPEYYLYGIGFAIVVVALLCIINRIKENRRKNW